MNSQHMHHIRDEISSLHLSYLQTEECLKKIGEQKKLEDVIVHYLSSVSHLEKLFFPKIACVLHNSIRDKKDFSPFKAISAWSALAKYAHNILTQPWRNEFYTIQKYGGYFSHVIKEVLNDWEIVFELMGYNTSGDIMILQKPIDPDKITIVARDCITAQVECQVMMKIYAHVLKLHNECTWQDILEFRETHVCSAEQAIRSLCAIFIQRQQDELVRDTCITPGVPYGYATLPAFHSTPCPRYSDYKQTTAYGNGLSSVTPHPKITPEKLDYTYSHLMSQDYPYPNCPKHVSPNPMHFNDSSYIHHYQGNRYGLSYPDKTVCPQFICPNSAPYLGVEVDNSDMWPNYHGYNYGMYPSIYDNNKYLSNQSYDYHKQRSKNLGKYDNPPKQNLSDNQARKNKDYLSWNVKCAPVTTDLENAMKAFSYDFDKNTISDNEQTDNQHLNNTLSESTTLPSKRSEKYEKKESAVSEVWECKNCTFHNTFDQSICELCDKSRNAGNEKISPIIGGRECHQCTLVNKKDAMTCEACNASLQDSPTYI